MPLIIDCYNLLHADMPPLLAGLEEDRLCRLLDVSRYRAGAITVVCDGLPKPDLPSRSPVTSVALIYSGRDRSADDVIIAMIDADSAPRRLVVVSDDREIQKAARRRRAKAVGCGAFVGELRALAERLESDGGDAPDLSCSFEGDAAHWAALFGLDPNQPIDARPSRRRRVDKHGAPPPSHDDKT